MPIGATNQTVDPDAKRIRDREDEREALRARIFGAQNEGRAPAELIARLEAEVRSLDAEIKALKAERPEFFARQASFGPE
jgi:chromosome segregation ATPase